MKPYGYSALTEPFVATMCDPAHMDGASLSVWDRTLRLARSSNLIGRLATDAQKQGWLQRVPAQVGRHLVAASRLVAHQQQAIDWECRHLEVALKPLGIPIVLLKGAAYAMTRRRAAQGRLFGDVDLLVPRESLNAVEAALMLHGWAIGAIDPYDQRYYRQWMHELPPMSHIKRGTVVDVHHNILPLSARVVVDAPALMANAVPVEGTLFRVLAPRDMVIHSAVHLFHEGQMRNGLRDLFDLDALLCEFAETEVEFWPGLISRAQELRLSWPLALALRYTREVVGTRVPQEIAAAALRSAGIGRLSLACFDAMYLRAFAPDHPSTRSWPVDVARASLFVRSHALRMPLRLLSYHLGRKLFLRLFKHTSRTAP